MASLPPASSSTLRAIQAAREAGATQWDSIGISMSELGGECDRALWYAHRWASAAEKLDAQKLRRFETGNIEEQRLIADVRRIEGVTVLDVDPDRLGKDGKPQQFKVYSHGGHVRGKLDGQVIGLPEAPKTWHVLECKSHNNDSFKALQKRGVKESRPAHFLQCQKYMQLKSLTRCLYIASNKNNDELYCERIEYDAVAVLQLDAQLDRVISSIEAPPRIKDKATAYPCIICRHRDVCHGETFGRNHCRTCLHSTPIVDAGHSAKWVCEKFGRELTVEQQRAGCHAHLYLPDAVPGKQVDAGDDWVAYELHDGSRWVDQEKKAPAEPEPRYWWHPISGVLWSSTKDEKSELGAELIIEELSAEEYEQALAYFKQQESDNEAREAAR